MEDIDFEPVLSGQNLVKGLRRFHKDQWPQFCDINIKCHGNILVPASKMLLSISSGFFQAFFRQQPDSQSVNLPEFDSGIVMLAIKSIMDPDLKEIEGDAMELVKVADYLQMEDLLMVGSKVLAIKLTEENILEVIDLIHSVQAPALVQALTNFLQKNIQSDFAIQAISKLPEEHFNSVFKLPEEDFNSVFISNKKAGLVLYDSYGRRYDNAEKLMILANAYYEILKSLDKLDSFNYIGLYSKCLDQGGDTKNMTRLLWMLQWIFRADFDTCKRHFQYLRPGLSAVLLHKEVHDLIKNQLDNLPRIPQECEDDEVDNDLEATNRHTHRYPSDSPYIGRHPLIPDSPIAKWSIEGNIRKINVKSRTLDGRTIVQGIQVFLDDETSKAFGMDLDDTHRVTSLVVPEGQHIKTMIFRSGWYIDAIGFETNKGQVIGLEGGTGGTLRTGLDKTLCLRHHYLREISGHTVMSQNGPFICHIDLCYDVLC